MRLLAQVGAGIFLRGLACSSGPRTSARDRTTCSTDTRWRHRQRVPNSRGSMPPVLRPTARPGRCRHRTRTPCRALVQHCEQVIHKSTITMGAADEWNAKAPSGRGEAAADAGAQPPIRCVWVASLSSNGSCVCHPPDLARAIAPESMAPSGDSASLPPASAAAPEPGREPCASVPCPGASPRRSSSPKRMRSPRWQSARTRPRWACPRDA